MFERIASLVVNDKGEYSKIHVFALGLAALHVLSLIHISEPTRPY